MAWLEPLRDMMQLAGWTQAPSADAPYTIAHQGRRAQLFSFPSLFSPAHYGYVAASDRFAFSAFELSRDLPGAFGVVA